MGSWVPCTYGPTHTHTAYASGTLAMPLNYTEVMYLKPVIIKVFVESSVNGTLYEGLILLQKVYTRTCLLQTALLSSTTVA